MVFFVKHSTQPIVSGSIAVGYRYYFTTNKCTYLIFASQTFYLQLIDELHW